MTDKVLEAIHGGRVTFGALSEKLGPAPDLIAALDELIANGSIKAGEGEYVVLAPKAATKKAK
jgi:hypothetical protein